MTELISIVTPTYNRNKEIKSLYKSLIKQKNTNFIWIVIDDGSTDDTKKFFDKVINNSPFKVEYYYKKNGGKHTALNIAFKKLKTKLFCIVDSDDTLTNDAIQNVYEVYEQYNSKNVFGFVYLKGYTINKPVTEKFNKDIFIGNYIKDVTNKMSAGDRFEIFYSELLSNHQFPIYEGEKFIGEGYFWNDISRNKNLVFINKIIYLCDYLTGGLTMQGRKMRINNSMGGITHALEYIKKDYSIKIRIKNMILYNTYYYFAKSQKKNPEKISVSFLKIICMIPGYFLYLYWNKKYVK